VFEKRVLKKILGPGEKEVKGEWRTLHNADLRISSFLQNSGQIKEDKRKDMGHTWERTQMFEIFWWKTRKIHRVEDLNVVTRIIFKMYLNEKEFK
jgi:hypothetical protein